ncbi:hypothetical protein ACFL0Y_04815 [Patescibacteria group bacterium]
MKEQGLTTGEYWQATDPVLPYLGSAPVGPEEMMILREIDEETCRATRLANLKEPCPDPRLAGRVDFQGYPLDTPGHNARCCPHQTGGKLWRTGGIITK